MAFFILKNCFPRAAGGRPKFVESTPHCHATPVFYAGSSKTNFTIKMPFDAEKRAESIGVFRFKKSSTDTLQSAKIHFWRGIYAN
jgi:hypothetical protein